jgi:DNA (cytosine-5)-methyltransferase 1
MKVIYYEIPEKVKVRKHKVDIKALKKTLSKRNISIKKISKILGVKKTLVEHWFRKDSCFSIPGPEYWIELKKILEIDTNKFDKSIMEFEEKISVHEQSNRVYDINGIAPTITSTSADIRIINLER